MEPAYEAVSCQKPPDLSRFGEKVIVDASPLRKGRRVFPVLSDEGSVISSEEASPFLREIPIGGKPIQVYVHPAFTEQLKAALECVE